MQGGKAGGSSGGAQAPRPTKSCFRAPARITDVNSGLVGAMCPTARPSLSSWVFCLPGAGSTLMGLPLGWGPRLSGAARFLPLEAGLCKRKIRKDAAPTHPQPSAL